MSASLPQLDPASTVDPWPYVAEITHRTLNDYTNLLAALRRVRSRVADGAAGQLIEEMAERLHSTARAYRALSPPRTGGERRLDKQLQELCSALTRSILADRAIRLTVICEPVSVSARRAWQLCVIVSELVSNAARHAFVEKRTGEIVIELRVNAADEIVCAVVDNGSAGPSAAPGCGTDIVDALTADLGGSVLRDRKPEEGLAVVLRVPRRDLHSI